MGNCIYCGEPVGFLKKAHKECKQRHEEGKSEIISLVSKVGSDVMGYSNYLHMNRKNHRFLFFGELLFVPSDLGHYAQTGCL